MTTPEQDRELDRIFDRPDVLSLEVEVRADGRAAARDQSGRTYLINQDGTDAQREAAETDPRFTRGHH